ncbi:MAG: tRNA-dihydrouridine synthase [Marinilabiliales bacterium]|nr:tRNA-dihydrouridine synthase [Marinilabiliales bacterium]
MNNFWQQLPKPFFLLAPMEDVTDTVFREVVARVSDPHLLPVLYTEFASVDGLSHPVGKKSVGQRLIINPSEKELRREQNIRLVAQIWGKNPELFRKIAAELTERGDFDGLDINMGCPVDKVMKNGCCAALIDQPSLATEIVLAVKESTHLPVSVKTRTGIRRHETERWMETLLSCKPHALILHGRTQVQQSDGLADWEEIGKAVRVRDAVSPETLLAGNGDVLSVDQGRDLALRYGVDGVMVGRGIFRNPWFFNPDERLRTKGEKLSLLKQHTTLFEQSWGQTKPLSQLQRFYKIYTHDFPGASAVRKQLMEARTFAEIYEILLEESVS